MEFKFCNVLIYGYSDSGHAVEEVLLNKNINYKIFDDKIINENNFNLDSKFIKKLNKKTLKLFDVIVLSPGVSIYAKNILKAKKLGVKVISEIEFANYFCNKKIIAVTGTNGKTTTVKLIHHILNSCNINVELLGNVGTPFSKTYNSKADVTVLEVSSFQLEAIEYFKPNIAVLLNVDYDHIDRHKTFKNYVETKFNIFKNQDKNDVAILFNESKNFVFENRIEATKYYINGFGIEVVDNIIYILDNLQRIEVCNINEIKNMSTCIDNILASILVCYLCKLSINDILSAINSFEIDKNRLEVAKVVNGVTYINDSKATNIHATKFALSTLKNKSVYLLIGGFDKKLDYTNFINNLPINVVKLILFGKLSNRLEKTCKKCGYLNYVKCNKLIDAINFAKENATKNSVVLLSPTSSSFDEFSSYVERGEFFINNI